MNHFLKNHLRWLLGSSKCSHSVSLTARTQPLLEAFEDRTLLTAGGFDTTFGTQGVAAVDFKGPGNAQAITTTTQTDGKLLVVGSVTAPSALTPNTFSLLRYSVTGVLDASFGTAGQVTFDANLETPSGVAVEPDGKILVMGLAPVSIGGFAIARFNTNGSLDTTFGTNGRVTTAFFSPGGSTPFTALFQPDNKFIVIGTTNIPNKLAPDTLHPSLARYNSDGSLDTTFGTDGKSFIVSDPGRTRLGEGEVVGAVLQADGSIFVATGRNHWLLHITANGALDTAFGTSGIVEVDFGDNAAVGRGLVKQSNGEFVFLAGGLTSNQGYGLARLTTSGALDTSFGTQGRVLSDFGSATPAGITVQADSKLVVGSTSNGKFAVARYNVDGSDDTLFGTGGVTTTDLGATNDTVSTVVLQLGNPVLVGSAKTVDPVRDLALARFTTLGTLDSTFGTGGVVFTLLLGSGDDTAGAIVVQPDGKILEAGNNLTVFALARFNANGTLDTTFGVGGRVTIDFAGLPDAANHLALQADGKILVGGFATLSATTKAVALARLNANGSLDDTFGSGGKVTLSFQGGIDTLAGVFVLPGGQILVAGSSAQPGSTHNDLVLARFQANGTLDTSFGTGGKVVSTTSFSIVATAAALQPDGTLYANGNPQPNGRLVVVGQAEPGAFSVTRFNADGSLDVTFAPNSPVGAGHVTTSIGGPEPDGATAVVIQSDGKIVVGGTIGHIDASTTPPHPVNALGLVRYNSDGSLDTTFGTGGIIEKQFAVETVKVALQPDGKIVVLGSLEIKLGSSGNYTGRNFADGTPDPTYGFDGFAHSIGQPGDPVRHQGTDLALTPGGNVLVAVTLDPDFSGRLSKDMAIESYVGIASRSERFVAQLYEDLMHRHPDSLGLQTFNHSVDQTQASRAAVIKTFMATDEYRTVIVSSYYVSYLHRAPDAGGLSALVTALKNGATFDQVKALFFASDEYFQTRGQGTNEGFLNALYQDILGRPLDASGRSTFGGALAAGISRVAVVGAILTSTETYTDLVGALYFVFLRRAVDPTGRDTFVSALQHGAKGEDVLFALLASEEYFSKV